MILDHINNKDIYKDIKFYSVLNFIASHSFNEQIDDKIIMKKNILSYAINTPTLKNKTDGFWESHKKYIDIHYILEGEEIIGYNPIHNLVINKEYNVEKDFITYFGDIQSPLLLGKGMFAVFYTNDAHMPNIKHQSDTCKKVVFKLNISEYL
jgi:biofilm protein TabA